MPEKRILENLFDRNGYVLNFSDRTFAEFFNDYNVSIDDEKYKINGTSKMKRMRAFWEIEPDLLVSKILKALLEYAYEVDQVTEDNPNRIKAFKIIERLQGKETPQKEKITPEQYFLRQKFSEIDLGKLNIDAPFREVLSQRIEEIRKTMEAGAPLSVIFLCGSTLEGLLLDSTSKHAQKSNRAHAAPKDKNGKVKYFSEWTLANLINVAYEVGLIHRDVRDYSHALRNFRNYIHPREQAVQDFNPDMHTAEMSWQVLQAAIADLSGLRK